ncbi:MAG: MerR family transcriptional regulator [Polyangiaceae bacterium]
MSTTYEEVLSAVTGEGYASEADVARQRPQNPEDEAAGYTIDELASASQIPSRTIRFYQSKGVLQPPEKRGRVAFYADEHLERLELIGKLQDRGLQISAIRTLLKRIDAGEVDLGSWLGLEAQLSASWAEDQPRTLTKDELLRFAGADRTGLIGDLLRLDVVARTGDVYLVRSPALLQIAMRLEAAGVDLDTAVGSSNILRKHLGRAAKEAATLFLAQAEKGHVQTPEDGDWRRLFDELRPTAIDAVRVIFAQEMERVLRELVESGKTASLPRPRKKKRGG